MAKPKPTTILSLSLALLFLLHTSIAQLELQQQQQLWLQLQNQQQHRLRAKTQCRIQQLTAHGPSRTLKSEAGTTECWDSNADEFQCAGVEFVRHVIQPRGLLLPYYSNSPQIIYIVQGSGIQGTVIPGCAETYESESGSESGSSRGGEEGRRSERHQKLRRFRQGDILALQEGFTNWVYNDGDTPIISVSLIDVANDANQLDLNFRKFFLAGNPGAAAQGQERESAVRRGEREEEKEKSNILSGFDEQLLAETFNVKAELARQLQGKEDSRGIIVRAEKMRLVLPEWGREEREEEMREKERGPFNGLEETFCSLRIRQNIDNPDKADVYNPKGGRISTLNSHKLPILSYLRLSAERGVLYRNAIRSPYWSTNAHSAMFVIRGSARIQVVGTHGNPVFDDEVREGQLLIVPQNFVVLKKANEEGFEWVAFKTNDNAMNGQLAGRLSALRAMPVQVLVNSYGISREDAKSLKYGREESTLLSPGSRSDKYA